MVATHALISLSDKTGVAELGQRLTALGIRILSTGGTARALRAAGVAVTEVSEHTGFPEILDGRVKTLHPRIHGGILARGGRDAATLAEHAIPAIGLVVVNLYPFRETVARPDCTLRQGVEQIDIGGPAMLRAAAKNFENVLVVVDPADYAPVLDALEAGTPPPAALRRRLATKAFAHTAAYDRAVFEWLATTGPDAGDAPPAQSTATALPEHLALSLTRLEALRYGENPHQAAAVYAVSGLPGGQQGERLLQRAGKALSFNNIVDAETALGCVSDIDECACVIVKHANPCGVAVGADPVAAYERALATDPTSAFGGIVAFNREVDAAAVQAILERQFVEVIVCPSTRGDVETVLAAKPAVRLLTAPNDGGHDDGEASAAPTSAAGANTGRRSPALEFHPVRGGLLVQETDTLRVRRDALRVVTRRQPGEEELSEMLFAWTVVKWVKSNAIVYTRNRATLGIGAGQTSRVDAARFGVLRAETFDLSLQDAVMASDAFFPFRDSIDNAAAHGVKLVIQPGGSRRDEEVIEAADAHDLAMVFTGHRHFRH